MHFRGSSTTFLLWFLSPPFFINRAFAFGRKQGVDVSLPQERVEVVYTGDTVMEGLVSQPMVWEAGLLIMEVTYLDGDGRAAAKNFHIHVQVRDEHT